MPHMVTIPAGSGGHVHAAVNVAVAVSVHVAAHTASPSMAPRGRAKALKPVQDEWGFFDPDQCGFRALLARLDAIAATEDNE